MDWLTFFSKTIAALSWPICVVVVVAIYKKELPSVLASVKRVKAGGIEIERLERIAEAVESKLDERDDLDEEDAFENASQLSQQEQKVLLAIIESRYAMRSITGVAKQTGLSKAIVNQTYSELIAKGFLEQIRNSRGQLRWYPTNLGHKVLAQKANKVQPGQLI